VAAIKEKGIGCSKGEGGPTVKSHPDAVEPFLCRTAGRCRGKAAFTTKERVGYVLSHVKGACTEKCR
jgi:hypothetical protein